MIRNSRKNKNLFKEGAGAGILITMKDLVGQFDHYKENRDGTVDVHLKNVFLEDCAIRTYYWSTEEWDFDGGKAVLTYDWTDLTDQEKKEFLDDLKNNGGVGTGSCTLTYGGGHTHKSLGGLIVCDVYGGISYDWNRLYSSLRDEVWDINITEIKLDFGNQLEEFYQDGYNRWMEEDDEYYSDEQDAVDSDKWMREKRIRNILRQMKMKVEKISVQKIKDWSRGFGFIWYDLDGTDYTVYSNGYSLIASTDKSLRDAVSKEKDQSPFQKGVSKEVYALVKKVRGSSSGNWIDTKLTVEDLKNNPEKLKEAGIKLNSHNLIEFLRMFSGYVTPRTPVYYNHYMDAIGIGYKGEWGILMCSL